MTSGACRKVFLRAFSQLRVSTPNSLVNDRLFMAMNEFDGILNGNDMGLMPVIADLAVYLLGLFHPDPPPVNKIRET